MQVDVRGWSPLVAALSLGLLLAQPGTAQAQAACKRYEPFEGFWQGTISDEEIKKRYPQPLLAVPDRFDPDHRKLDIVWRQTYYQVTWNSVEGENVPSLQERAQIAEDTDGYCRGERLRAQLSPEMMGLRINIQGTYDNYGVWVGFWTKMCCFLYQPMAMSCGGATHYRTAARGEERPWYDGKWYTTMTRQPRSADCADRGGVPSGEPGSSRPGRNFDPNAQ